MRWAGELRRVRLALEILLVVDEGAARVGHHHVAVVQILAADLQADVVRLITWWCGAV